MSHNQLGDKVKTWAEESLGQKILSVTPLKGGISSLIYDVETENGNVVLRLYNDKEWLQEEPDLASHEAASLTKANEINNVLTPTIINVDETGDICGMPAVLMSKIPGHIDLQPDLLDPWLKELAKGLAMIHRVEPENYRWEFFRYNTSDSLYVPEWTSQPELWKKGIEIVSQPTPSYKDCFIHRDYHPVNVLWQDGNVSGIVDWVNACTGPAGIDLGHCRINLAALFGVEAAHQFLVYYCSYNTDFEYDPYWDLVNYFDFNFPGPPDVYQGWIDCGIDHLTEELIEMRLESYLAYLLNMMGAVPTK